MSRCKAIESKRRKGWMREFEESPETRLTKDTLGMIEKDNPYGIGLQELVRMRARDACGLPISYQKKLMLCVYTDGDRQAAEMVERWAGEVIQEWAAEEDRVAA